MQNEDAIRSFCPKHFSQLQLQTVAALGVSSFAGGAPPLWQPFKAVYRLLCNYKLLARLSKTFIERALHTLQEASKSD